MIELNAMPHLRRARVLLRPVPMLMAVLVLVGALLAAGDAPRSRAVLTPLPPDRDGDQCADDEELGPQALLGGRRDPANPHDFFDVPLRDQVVSISDIGQVVAHFGATAAKPGGPPRYDPAFDRSMLGPDLWDLGASDGSINVQDIGAVIVQFGHYCDERPRYYTVADPAFSPLPGSRALYGTYSGGAYQIEVPDAWNGDLILWAHGFAGSGGVLSAGPPLQRNDIIARGYAWAASSYRENGYVPGYGARDTLALKDLFARLVGPPDRTYLVGASMGGHVATGSLEQAPGEYDGALAACGVVSGVEILDYLVASWGPVASYVTGVTMPDLQTADPLALMAALLEIMPLLGEPGAYTPTGEQFKSIMTHYTGGPRSLASEGFDMQFLPNFFVLLDGLNALNKRYPTSRQDALRHVATNEGASYHIDPGLGLTDEEINAGVARLEADGERQANSEFREFAPMTGQLSAPLMTIHGTGDLFVPISLEVSYLQKVQAAGKEDLLVQRAFQSAGHCNFQPEDVIEAFDDLVSWVETGVKPWGDDLSGDLSNIGH